MAKAFVIAVMHYQDRVKNGVQKDECIVLHYKSNNSIKTQPQMAVLYPKDGASRDVARASFLDEIELVIEPDPNNMSRNRIVDARLASVIA